MVSSEAVAGGPVIRDAILAGIVESAAPDRREELGRFARLFLKRVPEEDLALRSPREWGALLADLLAFLRERRAETVKLRRLEPQARGAGLELAAHGDPDPQRGHAVPRGLGRDGSRGVGTGGARDLPPGDRRAARPLRPPAGGRRAVARSWPASR
ncbi:MAG: glutamate dehydrogenase N terminal-domain containing protein [Xanthomonadales bacterium]|nr:glutamate dehydrogenase N terminal-domain containing protein [Xanthomonadales bacterium]